MQIFDLALPNELCERGAGTRLTGIPPVACQALFGTEPFGFLCGSSISMIRANAHQHAKMWAPRIRACRWVRVCAHHVRVYVACEACKLAGEKVVDSLVVIPMPGPHPGLQRTGGDSGRGGRTEGTEVVSSKSALPTRGQVQAHARAETAGEGHAGKCPAGGRHPGRKGRVTDLIPTLPPPLTTA